MDPTTAPAPQAATYPVQFGVDYPERQLNRLTTFFRIFTVIPIAIVLGDGDQRRRGYDHGRPRRHRRRRRRRRCCSSARC